MARLRIRLFDGEVTAWQFSLLLAWALGIVGIVGLWAPEGLELLADEPHDAFLGTGQLLGLLATYFALVQFLLMGRLPWIERAFGLDRLASFHRFNGYAAIILIVLHPFFITMHHVLEENIGYLDSYAMVLQIHSYTLIASIAEFLFIVVVLSSMYIARKRLPFESWYFVHLMVYAAIVLAAFHQFTNGSTLAESAIALAVWYGLYGFVAANILFWRFGMIGYNALTYNFRIDRVVRETPSTTSVYIRGNNIARLRYKPGQFVLVRILTAGRWWQEHPFSISQLPHDNTLRLTIKNVGDYTATIAQLQPGAKVFLSGPFGRFTDEVAQTDKRLYLAGGIGITPIRALLEADAEANRDTLLLYSVRTADDVPLKAELERLKSANCSVRFVYSEAKVPRQLHGRIDSKLLKKQVPDLLQRDIYLCGPPAMMVALIDQLKTMGLSETQLHYEQFSLHP